MLHTGPLNLLIKICLHCPKKMFWHLHCNSGNVLAPILLFYIELLKVISISYLISITRYCESRQKTQYEHSCVHEPHYSWSMHILLKAVSMTAIVTFPVFCHDIIRTEKKRRGSSAMVEVRHTTPKIHMWSCFK